MIIYHATTVTVDTFRAILGPMPSFICELSVFYKNFFLVSIVQNIFCMTLYKFMCICIYRSLPVLEDNFLALFLLLNTSLVSFLAAGSRMSLPGRPILNKVICTGDFYEGQFSNVNSVAMKRSVFLFIESNSSQNTQFFMKC